MSFYYKPCHWILRNDDWLHPLLFWFGKSPCQNEKSYWNCTRDLWSEHVQALLKQCEQRAHPNAHEIVLLSFFHIAERRDGTLVQKYLFHSFYIQPDLQITNYWYSFRHMYEVYVWSIKYVIITHCCFWMWDKFSFSRSFVDSLHHIRAAPALQESTAGRNPMDLNRPSQ